MTIEFERPQRDPLLAALIEKLPLPGSTWPRGDRQAWLDLMRAAFDLVYGRDVVAQGAAVLMAEELERPSETAEPAPTPRIVSPRAAARVLDADESSVAA